MERVIHIFGKRVGGILARFEREFSQEEFEKLTAAGLPPGWVAWHVGVPADETRRQAIAQVPVIDELHWSGLWVPADPTAELRQWIESQKRAAAASC